MKMNIQILSVLSHLLSYKGIQSHYIGVFLFIGQSFELELLVKQQADKRTVKGRLRSLHQKGTARAQACHSVII